MSDEREREREGVRKRGEDEVEERTGGEGWKEEGVMKGRVGEIRKEEKGTEGRRDEGRMDGERQNVYVWTTH